MMRRTETNIAPRNVENPFGQYNGCHSYWDGGNTIPYVR
jgi:hypothetical protein